MDFANRLHDLRRKKRLSQTELAKRVGVHYTQIGRYEQGSSRPSSDALIKLAEALEVSPDYLMGGTSEELVRVHIYDGELLRQFKQVEELDSEDKKIVKALLEAFLLKKHLQQIVK